MSILILLTEKQEDYLLLEKLYFFRGNKKEKIFWSFLGPKIGFDVRILWKPVPAAVQTFVLAGSEVKQTVPSEPTIEIYGYSVFIHWRELHSGSAPNFIRANTPGLLTFIEQFSISVFDHSF